MTPDLTSLLVEHRFQTGNINAAQADGRFTPLKRAARSGVSIDTAS